MTRQIEMNRNEVHEEILNNTIVEKIYSNELENDEIGLMKNLEKAITQGYRPLSVEEIIKLKVDTMNSDNLRLNHSIFQNYEHLGGFIQSGNPILYDGNGNYKIITNQGLLFNELHPSKIISENPSNEKLKNLTQKDYENGLGGKIYITKEMFDKAQGFEITEKELYKINEKNYRHNISENPIWSELVSDKNLLKEFAQLSTLKYKMDLLNSVCFEDSEYNRSVGHDIWKITKEYQKDMDDLFRTKNLGMFMNSDKPNMSLISQNCHEDMEDLGVNSSIFSKLYCKKYEK